MNKLIVIFIFLLSTLTSTVFSEGVSVHLSQRKVGLNESFSVTFSVAQGIKEPPDLSPLQVDFDIVSNNHESSISIINGQMSQEIRWNVVLIGKREGNLIIPAIQFGKYASSPQAIEVTSALAAKQDDDIFLEVDLSPNDLVYEQALLKYTVRLYCSVQMAQATLSEVSTNDKDAIVERLGNDIEYDHLHANGKRYRVYERRYVIFPQHAGELIFSPLVFEGAIISGRHSFFDMQTKVKRLHSDQKKITVQPIPAPFQKSNWLAANDVKLAEEWSVDPDKAVIGEPITWTLKLTADGCMGNHIPDLVLEFPSELKHYLDKAEVSNQATEDGFIGTKQIKVALIGTKPGKIQLPKVALSWWNLKSNKVQHIELPSRTLTIQDNNIAMNASVTEAPVSISTSSPDEELIQMPHQSFLWMWCIFGLGGALLIGLALGVYKMLKSKSEKPDSLKDFKNDLKKACQEGNAKQAEIALLAWFSHKSPQSKILNLSSLKNSLNEEFQAAINDLYQALYSKNSAWTGEALWKAFCAYKPPKKSNRKKKEKEDLLPELYS